MGPFQTWTPASPLSLSHRGQVAPVTREGSPRLVTIQATTSSPGSSSLGAVPAVGRLASAGARMRSAFPDPEELYPDPAASGSRRAQRAARRIGTFSSDDVDDDGAPQESRAARLPPGSGATNRTPSTASSAGSDRSSVQSPSLVSSRASRMPRLQWGLSSLSNNATENVQVHGTAPPRRPQSQQQVEAVSGGTAADALRARLAELEAEADSMVFDHSDPRTSLLTSDAAIASLRERKEMMVALVAEAEQWGAARVSREADTSLAGDKESFAHAVQRLRVLENEYSLLFARSEASAAGALRSSEELNAVMEVLWGILAPHGGHPQRECSEAIGDGSRLGGCSGATKSRRGAIASSSREAVATSSHDLFVSLRARFKLLGGRKKEIEDPYRNTLAVGIKTAQQEIASQREDFLRQCAAAERAEARAAVEDATAAQLEAEVQRLRDWLAAPEYGIEPAAPTTENGDVGDMLRRAGTQRPRRDSCFVEDDSVCAVIRSAEVSGPATLRPAVEVPDIPFDWSHCAHGATVAALQQAPDLDGCLGRNFDCLARVCGDANPQAAAATSLETKLQLLKEDCAALRSLQQHMRYAVGDFRVLAPSSPPGAALAAALVASPASSRRRDREAIPK